jgi:hypothetical protein
VVLMLLRCLTLAALIPAGAPAQSAPFPSLRPGEKLTYDANFGPMRVGRATMEVLPDDTVRGRSVSHIRFAVDGGVLWYKVRDRYDSWVDRERFVTLRFWKQLEEGKRRRTYKYEIVPERGVFFEEGKEERATVAEPLDDASLIYAVRVMPLDSGGRYDVPRYFIPDRNPVTLIVKRREKVSVPAGRFDAVVVQPLIKTTGIFGEGGRAELWFSDDANRYLLKLTAHVSFGTIILSLRSIETPPEGTR